MNIEEINLLPDERLDYINEDLSLVQLKNGLTFGTDAYLLSAFCKKGTGALADLGSGTGVVAFLCLSKNKYPFCRCYELQDRFASLIEKNARINALSDRIEVILGDIRSTCERSESFDAVISNPPYMKADSGAGNLSDEKNIARRELNGTIADFCTAATGLLKFGGLFYTVYRPDRLAELFSALQGAMLEPKKLIMVYPDAQSKPCLVLCESKKGAAPALTVSRALIIYNEKREYSADMAKIYDTCSTEHLFSKEV